MLIVSVDKAGIDMVFLGRYNGGNCWFLECWIICLIRSYLLKVT